MHSLVTWFKQLPLDCRMYTMHVSATYREIRNTLVTVPPVMSQHMRVGLILPSARISRSLSSHALPPVPISSHGSNHKFSVVGVTDSLFRKWLPKFKGTCCLQLHEEFGSNNEGHPEQNKRKFQITVLVTVSKINLILVVTDNLVWARICVLWLVL